MILLKATVFERKITDNFKQADNCERMLEWVIVFSELVKWKWNCVWKWHLSDCSKMTDRDHAICFPYYWDYSASLRCIPENQDSFLICKQNFSLLMARLLENRLYLNAREMPAMVLHFSTFCELSFEQKKGTRSDGLHHRMNSTRTTPRDHPRNKAKKDARSWGYQK